MMERKYSRDGSAMYWNSLVNTPHRNITTYHNLFTRLPLILLSICLNSLYTAFCHTNIQASCYSVTVYLHVFLCQLLVSFNTIQSCILLYSQSYLLFTLLQEHNRQRQLNIKRLGHQFLLSQLPKHCFIQFHIFHCASC